MTFALINHSLEQLFLFEIKLDPIFSCAILFLNADNISKLF